MQLDRQEMKTQTAEVDARVTASAPVPSKHLLAAKRSQGGRGCGGGGTPRSGRGHRAQAAPPEPDSSDPHRKIHIKGHKYTRKPKLSPSKAAAVGNKLRIHPKHASNVSRGPRRARGCSDGFDRAPGSSARAPTAPGPFPPTL